MERTWNFREILMIADFLGVTSKNTLHGKPFVGTWVVLFRNSYGRRERERERERERHKAANTPFLQFVVRR